MIKYSKRVYTDFEQILFQLSKNVSTEYDEALKYARKFTDDFAQKKKLNQEEKEEVMMICQELVQEWFPNFKEFQTLTF